MEGNFLLQSSLIFILSLADVGSAIGDFMAIVQGLAKGGGCEPGASQENELSKILEEGPKGSFAPGPVHTFARPCSGIYRACFGN